MTYFCEELRLGQWRLATYDHDPRAPKSGKDYVQRRKVRKIPDSMKRWPLDVIVGKVGSPDDKT